ncbi:MAG: replication initiation protein RepC [Paracoccaceae bacterium]
MKHTSQSDFGRALTRACPTAVDKWHALDTLTIVADQYDLNHRTLAVLRALMTFLPDRAIQPVPQQSMAYPSNNSLSKRLNGMPESTLRRHLSALVRAGIVSRHDSANRKRFSKPLKQGARLAFGFDLSPLARLWPDLITAAETTIQEQNALLALRETVAALRVQVLDNNGPSDITTTIQRTLRRRPNRADLEAAHSQLKDIVSQISAANISATDTQNERHIEPKTHKQKNQNPEYERVIATCAEYQTYFPQEPKTWQNLIRIAAKIGPMIGIDTALVKRGYERHGQKGCTTLILWMLDRLATFSDPIAYFQNSLRQGWSLPRAVLSADNL